MSLPTSTLLWLFAPPLLLLAITLVWSYRNWDRTP
jgi:hypothetical protein